jgi:NAD(P)H-flavin reductase
MKIIRRETAQNAIELSITVPRLWYPRAGHYVYLWAPRAFYRSFLQWHPFVVAWWSEDHDPETKTVTKTVSLLLEPQGGFSHRLNQYSGGDLFVVLDGPYGQEVDTTKHGNLCLVCTGIGIAAQLPIIKQTIDDHKANITANRRICLIWQIESGCQSHSVTFDIVTSANECPDDTGLVADWMCNMLKEDRDTKVCRSAMKLYPSLTSQILHVSLFLPKSGFENYQKRYGSRVTTYYKEAPFEQLIASEVLWTFSAAARTLITGISNSCIIILRTKNNIFDSFGSLCGKRSYPGKAEDSAR